ncbi:Na+/H+ antiporter NhaC family protein [Treponema phagedenis]|uniref:Na+/H+ antiporter NhaC family protein n=1 Tax=Treponema phagedenis TaxID=162 RepID=UPI0011E7876F|nr:Na+/H+ antiporter NhaC family protein [Treponema phagedenis]QEK00281.1 Na+/H+ antiporter NhaC family protein [Treponema phagedenis]QEK04514.1 Na+/H+ antiporter NhaC family protein [Treponema phagedenis]QEK10169.1 Na+/H+ antiporter NhaC family protein [Treponema phagedenis]
MEKLKFKPNGRALIPFAIFVVVYLGIGITLVAGGDPMGFYGFKGPIAVIVGIIVAFIMLKGSLDEKFDVLVKGCGDSNIITMCIIYILAGAFSVVSKQMGGVESTINLGLTFIPPHFVAAGLFIICCFLSLAMGTSVGTIAAVGPIAVGLAEKSGVPMSLMIGTLIGGAMFGDNLSIISDTTIAATKTQGVDMRDKFRVNLVLAAPAALITVVLLLIFGRPTIQIPAQSFDYSVIKVVPYIFVLVAALLGVNVFVVLIGGIILSGVIGMSYGIFGALQWTNHMYDGFNGMFEIFLLSMLTGGLAAMVTEAGGMEWLVIKIKKMIKGKKSAEVGIGALTMLTDAATANNTVAIIIAGPIVKELCQEFKIDPRRAASLLDAFSCVMQGIIPYGAQLLIACKFTNGAVSPVSLFPFLWYPFFLCAALVVSIFIPFNIGVIKNNPWNFEKWEPTK